MKRSRSKAAAAVQAMPEQPAAPVPAPAPTVVFAAGAATQRAWLNVQLPAGQNAPRHAAEAALLLHEVEPLLVVLDAWLLGSPCAEPDWRWCETPAPALPQAVACWKPGAEMGWTVTLGLPWTLLRRLPPPPPTLVPALQWQAADAVAVLAQPELSGQELAALEPGGALLLKAAFEPRWLGRLRAAAEPACVGLPVHWAAPGQPQAVPGVASEAAPGSPVPPLEVRCFSRAPLPAEVLAGWSTPALAPEPAWQAEISLWSTGRAEAPAECCLARGHLLPWGRGQAMSIAAVGPDASI